MADSGSDGGDVSSSKSESLYLRQLGSTHCLAGGKKKRKKEKDA